MDLILDFSMAWLATFAMLAVLLKYTARMARMKWKNSHLAASADAAMHQLHKPAGIVVVAAGLIHGWTSSDQLLSINLGTVLLVLAMAMGVLYAIRKKVRHKRGWMHTHRLLAIITATVLFCHVVEVGGIQVFHLMGDAFSAPAVQALSVEITPKATTSTSSAVPNSGTTVPASPTPTATELPGGLSFSGVTLADGIYAGTAQGYRPGLSVAVIVEDGLVASIEVTDHSEVSSRFYTRPIALIPDEIVDSQSLDVDTVSGATMTSIGILNAVRNALLPAVTSGQLPDALPLPQGRMH